MELALREADKYGMIKSFDITSYFDNMQTKGEHTVTVNITSKQGRGTLTFTLKEERDYIRFDTEYSEIENYGKRIRDPRFYSPYALRY